MFTEIRYYKGDFLSYVHVLVCKSTLWHIHMRRYGRFGRIHFNSLFLQGLYFYLFFCTDVIWIIAQVWMTLLCEYFLRCCHGICQVTMETIAATHPSDSPTVTQKINMKNQKLMYHMTEMRDPTFFSVLFFLYLVLCFDCPIWSRFVLRAQRCLCNGDLLDVAMVLFCALLPFQAVLWWLFRHSQVFYELGKWWFFLWGETQNDRLVNMCMTQWLATKQII